jgi:hypothetical protein
VYWLGEHNADKKPHGRVIVLKHGAWVKLANYIDGNIEGKALKIEWNGSCYELTYKQGE